MKKYNNIIGISIEYDGVSMFQNQGGQMVSVVRRLPENVIQNGEIKDPERIARFIDNMVKNGGFHGRECAVVLPEYSTYFRMLDLPPMTDAELKLNLPYEFRDFVGEEGKDYFYDYALDQIVQSKGTVDGMQAFAGAVQKNEIQKLNEIYLEAGLKMKLALPREMAIVNILRNAIREGSDPDREFCIVDIGYRYIRVYIVANARIAGSKVIYMGTGDLDQAIESYLGVSRANASALRRNNVNSILSEDYCQEVCDAISVEVMKAINFYRFENPESQIDNIYFFGIDSDVPEIRNAILERVELWERGIEEILPSYCEGLKEAASCVMAIGVVMQEDSVNMSESQGSSSIKLPSKETMNLFMKEGSGGSSQKKLNVIVGILIILFLIFGVAGRYVHVYHLKQALETSKTELTEVQSQLTDYPSVKKEYDRYAKTYMNARESAMESRQEFISIAEGAVGNYGTIESISIVGNEAVINVKVSKLSQVAKIRKSLESYKVVKSVNIYTASDNADGTSTSGNVKASLVFQIGKQIEEADE